MGLTRFPNGVTANSTTALMYNTNAGDGDLDCLDLFTAGTASIAGNLMTVGTVSAAALVASGSVTAANGSVYGGKVSLAFAGSAAPALYLAALTSALYDSGATIMAPFKCLPEIVWVAGATGSVTVSVRVTAGSVSTAADVATLSVGSATTQALTAYTTIGATALGQGSFLHITSAIMATANSSSLMINLIPVA